jgi:hypothetical protein
MDCVRRSSKGGSPARLHLDKDEYLSDLGDQIKFTEP